MPKLATRYINLTSDDGTHIYRDLIDVINNIKRTNQKTFYSLIVVSREQNREKINKSSDTIQKLTKEKYINEINFEYVENIIPEDQFNNYLSFKSAT